MTTERIAAALGRLETVLRRRPTFAEHEDKPAIARWQGGTRFTVRPAQGDLEILTDLPAELGGDGEGITPGWLMRAGLAACAASSIRLQAAVEGIELESLEATASSRSDVRGLLGMTDESGVPTPTGYGEVRLLVRVSAPGVARERLQALIERANALSPVANALQRASAIRLSIELQD